MKILVLTLGLLAAVLAMTALALGLLHRAP